MNDSDAIFNGHDAVPDEVGGPGFDEAFAEATKIFKLQDEIAELEQLNSQSVTEWETKRRRLSELSQELTEIKNNAERTHSELSPQESDKTTGHLESGKNTAGIDRTMLADRDQLIQAFGHSSGMDKSWFKNVTDTPKLLEARKVSGTGGRGHIAEPLFCPLEVALWMGSSRRKKGNSVSEARAWQLLEDNFPKVYSANSISDPR